MEYKKLRVLFQSRLDLFDYPGGDTNQILETKAALEKLGVNVDIDLSLNPNLDKYDLVHIFNFDWVCEPYFQVKNAKKQGKKVVLSPIHHSQKEFDKYEKYCRYGLARVGNFIIRNQELRDNFRNLIKGIIYPKKFYPAIYQLFYGIRRAQKYCIKNSDFILVQTDLEARDLKKDFGIEKFNWRKVVNGANTDHFYKKLVNTNNPTIANVKKLYPDFLYSVGRIEPRKNQLKLIKAFLEIRETNNTYKNLSLLFSGRFNNHHPTYVSSFKKLLKNHSDCIFHTGFFDQRDLPYFFQNCKVYIVPSWFETTGLTFLEAVLSGAKSLVASGERTQEYLKDNALYCDPSSVEDIKRKLLLALNKPTVRKDFISTIKTEYSWVKAAKETLKVYNLIK